MTSTRAVRILQSLASVALLTVGAAACDDGAEPLATAPQPDAPGRVAPLAMLECAASRSPIRVACAPARAGRRADIIILGAGAVKLTSSNLQYDAVSWEFNFDVTVQNLIQQPIGTTDGTTSDKVRVFFYQEPIVTSGSGDIEILPDGRDVFTASNQAYYEYAQMLSQNAVSSPRTWMFLVPPTVNTFSFLVYVSAPVQYPSGYVELDGYLPGAGSASVQAGNTHALVTSVENARGNAVPGTTVTYSSSNTGCATVDASGVVTGVAPGSCTITATSGARAGSIAITVTP